MIQGTSAIFMKKLEFKNFDLQKVKVNAKNGIYVEWYDLTSKNDLLSIDSDSVPHEDLFDALSKFKEPMGTSLGILKGFLFARVHLRDNLDLLKQAVDGYESEVERCNVGGINFVGSGENEGLRITGSLRCDIGSVGMSTSTIKFEDEESDLGELVFELSGALKKEVFAFIYQGKRANDLFSDVAAETGLNNLKKVV